MPSRRAPHGAWDDYHAGLALAHHGDAGAGERLRRARAGMLASADAQGTGLCAAALLLDAQACGPADDVAAWLGEARGVASAKPSAESVDDELLALAALLTAHLACVQSDPDVDRVVARIVDLLGPDGDVNLTLAAAVAVLHQAEAGALHDLGERVIQGIEPRLAESALTPYRQELWSLARRRHGDAGRQEGAAPKRWRGLLDGASARVATGDSAG